MGDVTRPAPGSLGGRANESAVGGASAARGRRVLECAGSRAAQAGEALRPVPPRRSQGGRRVPGEAALALLAPRAWDATGRRGPLALCGFPHRRELCSKARVLGPVR